MKDKILTILAWVFVVFFALIALFYNLGSDGAANATDCSPYN